MLAGDNFVTLNREQTSFDTKTFTLLYLPIIGRDAYALYQLLRISSTGKITFFLEYLGFGPNVFQAALDKLSALDLLSVYDNHTELFFELRSPKTYEEFMKDDFMKQLLLSKVDALYRKEIPEKTQKPKGQNISRKFYEVYHTSALVKETANLPKEEESFNMGAFELAMKDQKLSFANENQDKLALYQYSQKFDKSWFELFNLATQTKNSDGTLNLANLARLLSGQSADLPKTSDFPQAIQDLIAVAKSHQSYRENNEIYDGPAEFLQQLRKNTGGTTSSSEYKILNEMKRQSIPDEVQNILLHYVLVQRKNSVLNATFVHQLTNECLQNKIYTAEQAAQWFANREKRQKERQSKYTAKPKLVKKAPEWSNANYVETTSTEARAKFAELQKKMREETANGINRRNS